MKSIRIKKENFDINLFLKISSKNLKLKKVAHVRYIIEKVDEDYIKIKSLPEKYAEVKTALKNGDGLFVYFAGPFVCGGPNEKVDCVDGKKLHIPQSSPSYYGEEIVGYVIIQEDDFYVFKSYITEKGVICEMLPSLLPYSSRYLNNRMQEFLKKFIK